MPVSRRAPSDGQQSTPSHLRPYSFHGADLAPGATHAVGDCPFCGRSGRFSVDLATGLWRCWACGGGTEGGGGNALTFARLVYERAAAANVAARGAFLRAVAKDRRLLGRAAVVAWGVVPAADGTWLVPGYSAAGRLDQVYRRTRMQNKGEWAWRLLPTPGIWPEGKAHGLHLPAGDFDPARPRLDVFEGPWDGMAAWEVWDRGAADTNLVAVPGCNVWRDEWTELCRGKVVTLHYDSDHPRELSPGSGRVTVAGRDGARRVAGRLSGVAAQVRWLAWGPDGYDPACPSGWDVRDHLSRSREAGGDRPMPEAARRVLLGDLLSKVEEVPAEWFSAARAGTGVGRQSGEALPCSRWVDCEAAWREAMRWRGDMGDALAVLLAVCASTQQAGNQLFLDLIGSPGGAKTTLCRGLLVSSQCVHLENVTKLLSGFVKPGDSGKDCSFLARANGRTWVTCEFDVLGSSPQYHELMGKVRRIFDGETSATYGNSDEDRVYTALRTPWIRAGTPRMMDHDQSQLGDRFLRYILLDPDWTEKRAIARQALRLERAALVERANCTAGSIVDAPTRRAQGLTGGYVDWLRDSVEGLLPAVHIPPDAEEYCLDLAELSADLRARPQKQHKHAETVEAHDYKELPTRLARQNVRLAACLAVVLNRTVVDRDILRVVRKVALDTAAGHSANITRWLCSAHPVVTGSTYQEAGGISEVILQGWTGMTRDNLAKYLAFLRNMDVLRLERSKSNPAGGWLLTERVYDLYLRVMGD